MLRIVSVMINDAWLMYCVSGISWFDKFSKPAVSGGGALS